MFIQTEQTPNPATLKFLPGQVVLEKGTADFPNADAGKNSPLARALFSLDGVRGVFLGHDFITVTKAEARDWSTLKAPVLAAIMDHFLSGLPAVNEAQEGAEAAPASETERQIRA
ncbi:MAG TPA: NifU N-terminal domain-containing protein, partial [Alphaproteobacteria bacterium]|nr:NifU N-terminal domain-containing protein [Alphaproteobacteria bacterium]